MDLLEELESRVVCGDGAMGTLLQKTIALSDRCLEEICVSDPDRISEIHDQYIAAGARVIKTNTFGANAVRLERFGFEKRVSEINKMAANLARQAANGKDVYVAGSVGPLGISAEEAKARVIDREACFREQVKALREADLQIIFFETFTDFVEMATACGAAKETDCLTICSFACTSAGGLSSGMLLVDAFLRLRELGADCVGINCVNGPDAMVQLLRRMPTLDQPLAAYPNAGHPKCVDERLIYHVTPDDCAKAVREMVAEGAKLIGGCCGTSPRHVAAISAAIADL